MVQRACASNVIRWHVTYMRICAYTLTCMFVMWWFVVFDSKLSKITFSRVDFAHMNMCYSNECVIGAWGGRETDGSKTIRSNDDATIRVLLRNGKDSVNKEVDVIRSIVYKVCEHPAQMSIWVLTPTKKRIEDTIMLIKRHDLSSCKHEAIDRLRHR